MVLRVLVETGFMLALNPRDKHHKWAMKVLEEAKRGNVVLYISPVAPIELSLIMKSRNLRDEDIVRALNAIETIINRYTKPQYPHLGLRELIYATKLRTKYSELTFFNSIHTAIAIINSLTYYDLDPLIREIILNELRRAERT